MPDISVEILGVHEAVDLGVRFERAGDGHLKRDLASALREAHVGISAELRASALARLPKRNGLAEAIASSHISVSTSTSGEATLTVSASNQYDLAGIDNGLDIHPLWGDKKHWYLQRVRSGWFTEPLKLRQHTTTESFLERAVDRFANGIG